MLIRAGHQGCAAGNRRPAAQPLVDPEISSECILFQIILEIAKISSKLKNV